MIQLLQIVYYLLAAWLIFQLSFPFVTVLASRLFGRERPSKPIGPPTYDFACIITAYKNSAIAKPLVESLLHQTHLQYTVYLVADECPDLDFGMDDDHFVLLRPALPLRLKIKSIQYAMDRFLRPHDFTVVFDADNLAHPHFLEIINTYAQAGHHCIQGRRAAKNIDSGYAGADALGEIYKNYIERYAPYLLGGSAVISGSGMATETQLYRAYLDSTEIVRGRELGKKMLQEDKILQNFLLRRDIRIAYARLAVCYDEKVSSGEAVQTQRSRWLFSYFQNIPNALGILCRGLVRGNAGQFFFGIVTLAPPMFIQVGLACFFIIPGLFIAPWVSLVLFAALLIFAANVLWVLKLSHAPPAVWKAIWHTPQFVARQALGLLKMRNPEKNFRHSEHRNVVSVDEVLNKK